MDIQIITVGTELLLGDTLDTNSQFLSQKLKAYGLNLYKKVTVGDNVQRLEQEIHQALKKVDMVILTGGLGPTKDDLTKETAVKVLGQESVVHEESYLELKKYFQDKEEAMEGNIKQAMFPENAIVLPNKNGTAPGAILTKEDKYIIVLPGPPKEMIPMFENYLDPFLQEKSDSIILSETITIGRLGEWEMAKRVEEITESYQNPSVAPYFSKDGVLLKITAKAETKRQAEEKILPVKKELKEIFGSLVLGENGETRQELIYELLKKFNLKVMTAESITGGLVAASLIDVAGMSDHLKESLVVYSDEAKVKYLNVSRETLEKYTAVSGEVCKEMVEGLLNNYDTNLAITTTGYAGPGENAGLAYIGVGYKEEIWVKEFSYKNKRNVVRDRVARIALEEALFLLRDILL